MDHFSYTGGAYIPPARLRMMQEQITDKSSENYQRLSWEALKKSINGLVNKVNVGNMSDIIRELFKENIVRGRGLLARSVITAQAASPTFTHVYAALVAVINTKFPQIGELLLKRLLIQFKRTMKRGDKATCLTTAKFLAHLVNQQVIHELVILEILTVFLENPTEDSVEVAVGVIKECGKKLGELSPTGIRGIFDRFRSIIQDSDIGKRVQYMIEVLFAIRKDDFKDYPTVIEELVLVEESDQITHFLSLDDAADGENILNIFKFDPDYLQNEERYQVLRKGILGDDDDGSSASGSDEESDDDDDDDEEEEKGTMILDQTETNLVALRRNIYLTIQSSLDFEECAHKLLKMEIKPGQEKELCSMIIDCCAQERSYLRMYGLLAQRFCQLNKTYVELYDEIFQDQYENCHRLETNKLRNVVKFFAHLFFTDAIPWTALSCIHLNEDETTSSSRIFAKILLQELSEYMGIMKLNKRFRDETLAEFFEGLFPRNNPSYTRFAINFFTSIGLGALTDELRAHLKNAPKLIMAQKRAVESSDDSSSSDSNSDSDSDSDSSSESTSSSSGSSEDSGRNSIFFDPPIDLIIYYSLKG
ncbi:uncharacterized protein TRIADDRAFT_23262 [Trichoplax adhaerens]|uniref:MI domain-containing protein n=1 Tax=Trichoplax adhaerens TaxID=10228 RepID=B3RS05_TRIAD|nr:hypothetical protein TRIADDRAFT_23262 [Trichoplax adhaerens]EDV26964.1 hypothetical protein TRIADDRAFT_23262 [Trichoplax adhaerens]|eukprot:XP_002110960.1 hypothetical protein TRIADDRAFT_23262 [Trichoplax adhaerens]